jgi:hypothetical protein
MNTGAREKGVASATKGFSYKLLYVCTSWVDRVTQCQLAKGARLHRMAS